MIIAAYMFTILGLLGLTVYFVTLAYHWAWLSNFDGADLDKLRWYFWMSLLLGIAALAGAAVTFRRLQNYCRIEDDEESN